MKIIDYKNDEDFVNVETGGFVRLFETTNEYIKVVFTDIAKIIYDMKNIDIKKNV